MAGPSEGVTEAGSPPRPFDADNHYYESRDCFTRHIEPRHRHLAIRVDRGDDGRDRIFVGERPFTFLPYYSFDTAVRPGALREMLRNLSARTGDVEGDEGPVAPFEPAYVDRDARIRLMDEQGLEAAFLMPTLGVCVEHFMKEDPVQTFANLRAFNRWLDETWGLAWRGRIFAHPLLSLVDLDAALAELDWVMARGARVIHLRPGPQRGRSPGDPAFDAFWERVNEAGLAVSFHISESGYNELFSVHWGEEANPSSHQQSAFQWTVCYGDRPIMDTLASLIFLNFFGRFPRIRVMSLENGSLWVPYLMKAMDKMGGMGRNGPWRGGRIRERPSAIFRRHVYVSPYHEEDIPALVAQIGAERVLFGSDFPHAEGLARPTSFRELLDGLPHDARERIMRHNARELIAAPR